LTHMLLRMFVSYENKTLNVFLKAKIKNMSNMISLITNFVIV